MIRRLLFFQSSIWRPASGSGVIAAVSRQQQQPLIVPIQHRRTATPTASIFLPTGPSSIIGTRSWSVFVNSAPEDSFATSPSSLRSNNTGRRYLARGSRGPRRGNIMSSPSTPRGGGGDDVVLPEETIRSMEDIIGQDDGNRGMKSLVVPGDLLLSATTLSRLAADRRLSKEEDDDNDDECPSVVILSGFPCCVNDDPPTETDGPPGTYAIARCCLALGYDVTVVTDECNGTVFEAARRCLLEQLMLLPDPQQTTKQQRGQLNNKLSLELFPPESSMTFGDKGRMECMVRERCDLVISCERAGPARDGNCYTMRGIDMTSRGLIAPVHTIVDLARSGRGISSEKDSNFRGGSDGGGGDGGKIPFIAVGDGGNELGMGKVYDAIVNNDKIDNGEQIAAVTPADYLIAASVSNWGGYALAAAACLVRRCCEEDDNDNNGVKVTTTTTTMDEQWLDRCVPTENDEIELLRRCVDVGCRDGVSGKVEATVDGMPLEKSLDCLTRLRKLAMGGGD